MNEVLTELEATQPQAWGLLIVMTFLCIMIVRIQYEKDKAKIEKQRREDKWKQEN